MYGSVVKDVSAKGCAPRTRSYKIRSRCRDDGYIIGAHATLVGRIKCLPLGLVRQAANKINLMILVVSYFRCLYYVINGVIKYEMFEFS